MNSPHPIHQAADRLAINAFLREFMTKALPDAPSEEDFQIPFLEMGANSLVLMEVQRAVEARFGLTIAIPQFFQELTTMEALAEYVELNQKIPAAAVAPAPAVVAPTSSATVPPAPTFAMPALAPMPSLMRPAAENVAGGELEAILVRQIETASRAINQVVAQQLQFLGGMGLASAAPVAAAVPTAPAAVAPAPVAAAEPAAKKPASAAVMHRMLSPLEIRARGLTPLQSRHLEALIARYTARTRRSKELAVEHRPALADSRAAVGFRFTTKEMLYPIVGKRGRGAYVWDVDGNKYVDITMGQGVTLFGHHPEFVDAALNDPENDMTMLGPRPPAAGEAAQLIREMTGMDRVTFTNSGTEAVMAALRLARAYTKRNKIVMFDNAYHGHSDNVMGRPVTNDGVLSSVPVAPGIMQGAVDDLWLLEYGSDEALDFIRKHASEIATVVVEPVQSRRPDLQPREFLHELRRITEQNGVVLFFDEMITGFRLHPGGAQAWFGVKADLATYGKVLAGGMPIGVVAGKAAIMDAIDGGMWNYGDASYPVVDRTIFGGTFCQHPAAMIAMLAVLRHLKAEGPALQERLNRRTQAMAAELNEFFDAEDVPIRVVHFASLFRFSFSTNLELLFYHLMEKGIFIWEWRNYFLSTAHGDAEVAAIVQAVKDCVMEMRAGGFLPEKRSISNESTGTFPLTTAQKQLAVLAQINPAGSMAYHVSPLLEFKGHLEVPALRLAVRETMRRHEALRTVVDNDQQTVMALSQLPGGGAMSFTDLSAEPDPAAALAEALRAHASRPFDLARGPLFEAHLFRLGAEQHRLLLKAHHIVVDGLSTNLIVQDLAALYSATLRSIAVDLPPAKQLRDYVQWRAATSVPQQETYWLKQLSGDLPALDLPVDRPEPPVKSFQGGRLARQVPRELFAAVRSLSRTQGCTHFMTLFAAYSLWLHRLCDQEEVLVGMPVAGRAMKDSDHLAAYCTHLIPIRSRVQWDQSFNEYLKSMRDTLLQGYQHQDYPFADLMNALRIDHAKQGKHRQPHGGLVSVLFNLDRPGVAPTMDDLQVEWLSQPIYHTAFDLTLNLTEIGEEMVLECDYNRDLFDEASIARYVGHFLTLLRAIVQAPQTSLARLPLLDADESRRVLCEWNDTAADYPRDATAHRLFEEQVERTPTAEAVSCGDTRLSYAELNAEANRLAAWLRAQGAQGVRAETVVGVCAERSPELVVALLAILKAGGAYLPLDPSYPPARLSFMLDDARAPILLTQERLKARLGDLAGVRVLCLDSERAAYANNAVDNVDSGASAEQLAYLIYTSGSTGKPKGTLIVHRGLVNYLSWAVKRYEVAQGAGSPLHSSISFDATITSLFAPLVAGRALAILPEGGQEIDHIRAALQSGREWSLVKLTPAHLELINALIPSEQLAGLTRYVVLGGEALLQRHVAPWQEGAPQTRLINEYGPTETVVGCCVYQVGEKIEGSDPAPGSLQGAVPIGKPIANTQLYVLDRRLQPVPVGVKGELYIGGDGVARGYHQRPELTAERFVPLAQTGVAEFNGATGHSSGRLYRTGDVVRYLPDGHLVYLGRIDNQVKVRGFRIELGEIEGVLAHLPGVREAVVIAQRRSDQDMRLIAYVSPTAGASLDERALRQSLSESLPTHMLPSAFVVLDTLPLTSNGKVDRAALPLPDALRRELDASFVDARNDAEKKIAAVWRELLEVERVGVNDNFFELGGHSLLVLPLRDRLQTLFGRPISPVEIFRLPTVATQAQFMTQDAAASEAGQAAREDEQRRSTNRRDAFQKMKEKRQGR